jgi:hypothetical protein
LCHIALRPEPDPQTCCSFGGLAFADDGAGELLTPSEHNARVLLCAAPAAGSLLTKKIWNLFVALWGQLVDALNSSAPADAPFFASAPAVAAVATKRSSRLANLDGSFIGGFNQNRTSQLLDADMQQSDAFPEEPPASERMAAFLREAACCSVTHGSALRPFADALYGALESMARDSRASELADGLYASSIFALAFRDDYPCLTKFKIATEKDGSVLFAVRLSELIAHLRSKEIFSSVVTALAAFDSEQLDLSDVLQQMHEMNDFSVPHGAFIFSKSNNPVGLVALVLRQASASAAAPQRASGATATRRAPDQARQVSRGFWGYSELPLTLLPYLVRAPTVHPDRLCPSAVSVPPLSSSQASLICLVAMHLPFFRTWAVKTSYGHDSSRASFPSCTGLFSRSPPHGACLCAVCSGDRPCMCRRASAFPSANYPFCALCARRIGLVRVGSRVG